MVDGQSEQPPIYYSRMRVRLHAARVYLQQLILFTTQHYASAICHSLVSVRLRRVSVTVKSGLYPMDKRIELVLAR